MRQTNARPGGGAGDRSTPMTGYPIQPSKIQAPTLREETLARDRLLEWLAAKAHSRVLLILADAGYGKTTLLADFSRRTRLRTLWYRLDDDDRDWVTFISHLVAAGKEHDPDFAPLTAAMLTDTSTDGPSRDAVTDTFVIELSAITGQGAVLILDDFHLVDDSTDVRTIVRELVVHGPERLSIAFASRRSPSVPIARLRASGEVAELGTDDLRFDPSETARLFSETYGRELEPDVLADVAARTEGWAASLQLVHAALRDRSPSEIRRFIRSLSGADRELYDYLAEEVVGDLPDDLQQFLMRTSILQVVTPDLAAVVSGFDSAEVTRLTSVAERMTLLSRTSRGSRGQRFHPLVREFLEARLRSSMSEADVAHLHMRVADAASEHDWRTAAHHYREAGEHASVAETIASALPDIIGGGQQVAAAEAIELLPPDVRLPSLALVDSRVQMQHRQVGDAIALSRSVLEQANLGTPESDFALLNLASSYIHKGITSESIPVARLLGDTTADEQLRLIARGTALLISASRAGDLNLFKDHLREMAEAQRNRYPHFFGVTALNLAIVAIAQDDPESASRLATEAIDALESTSSRIELSAAYTARASALAMLAINDGAMAALETALDTDDLEASMERADLADSYLDPDNAGAYLNRLIEAAGAGDDINALTFAAQQQALYLARRRQSAAAGEAVAALSRRTPPTLIASPTLSACVEAYVAAAAASPDALRLAQKAREAAVAQNATRWIRVADLLVSHASAAEAFNRTVAAVGRTAPWNVTFVADLIVDRLDDLGDEAWDAVVSAATRHPARWRSVLRRKTEDPGEVSARAASLLDRIGDKADIGRLRELARRHRRSPVASDLGRGLARRLAEKVYIEDLGAVSITIGTRSLSGSTTRRKVLGLLCFLLTKPAMTSPRDQVLDAIWPDLDPVDALNSLNQTVYFLRRVFEEKYVDDLSPGYVHHESDLIWLDQALVASRSNECRAMIKSFPNSPSADQVTTLVDRYQGRFALDFEYEEWASPYRDWLHAAYLEIVERAVVSDLESGHFARGISVARRVLDVDPNAENVELSLLRLYRASGAHAAAAEQYSHYASTLREQVGIEPPPLESL
jgi:DNA-binding SARP family transcriptional activator